MGITDVKGHFIHVAARQSPYPGTSIARFPVFDKYVPWEVSYTEHSCGYLFTDVKGITDVKGHSFEPWHVISNNVAFWQVWT